MFEPLYPLGKNKPNPTKGFSPNIDKADSQTNNAVNPTPIIQKTLGGYNREQLNDIYLIRILLPYKAKTVMDKVYLFGINLDNVSQKTKL